MNYDWSHVAPKPKPSKKMVALYRGWKRYLSDSRLSTEQIERDSRWYAERMRPVPND